MVTLPAGKPNSANLQNNNIRAQHAQLLNVSEHKAKAYRCSGDFLQTPYLDTGNMRETVFPIVYLHPILPQ